FHSAGYYPPGNVEWSVPLICYAGATQKEIYEQLDIKQNGNDWIWADAGEPFKPKQHFKLMRFTGKNWHGIATAIDQIYYAPPDQRSRFFNFCLMQKYGPQVLC